jgi:hypothetical protein
MLTSAYLSTFKTVQKTIERRLNEEDYSTISYFSKTRLNIDWPLVESAVKQGETAYVIECRIPELADLAKQQRTKLYHEIRKVYKGKGWTSMFFEYTGDEFFIALVKRM